MGRDLRSEPAIGIVLEQQQAAAADDCGKLLAARLVHRHGGRIVDGGHEVHRLGRVPLAGRVERRRQHASRVALHGEQAHAGRCGSRPEARKGEAVGHHQVARLGVSQQQADEDGLRSRCKQQSLGRRGADAAAQPVGGDAALAVAADRLLVVQEICQGRSRAAGPQVRGRFVLRDLPRSAQAAGFIDRSNSMPAIAARGARTWLSATKVPWPTRASVRPRRRASP